MYRQEIRGINAGDGYSFGFYCASYRDSKTYD